MALICLMLCPETDLSSLITLATIVVLCLRSLVDLRFSCEKLTVDNDVRLSLHSVENVLWSKVTNQKESKSQQRYEEKLGRKSSRRWFID